MATKKNHVVRNLDVLWNNVSLHGGFPGYEAVVVFIKHVIKHQTLLWNLDVLGHLQLCGPGMFDLCTGAQGSEEFIKPWPTLILQYRT